MASRILRRSGIAVCQLLELYKWRPDVIIQVGVGVHHEETDVMMETWPSVRLIGFEPDNRVRKMAKEKYPGEVLPQAISDTTAPQILYTKKGHGNGSSLHPLDVETEYEVECTTLDNEFWRLGLGNIDNKILLWLDCEGHELPALQGGRAALGYVQFLNIEMTGKPPNREWSKPKEVHEFLLARGFERIWIHTTRSIIGQYDAVYCRHELVREDLRVW